MYFFIVFQALQEKLGLNPEQACILNRMDIVMCDPLVSLRTKYSSCQVLFLYIVNKLPSEIHY